MRHLLFLLFLAPACSGAQMHQTDSLKGILASAVHDSIKSRTCLALGAKYYLSDMDSALYWWKEAARIAENGIREESNSSRHLPWKRILGETYNGIAFVYSNQGNIQSSLDFYFKALKLTEETGDMQGVAAVLNNLGHLQLQLEDTTEAMAYYNRSLEISFKLNDQPGISSCLNNIGHLLVSQGRDSLALEHYSRSLAIKRTLGDIRGMGTIYHNIGNIYHLFRSLDSALVYYQKALEIRESIQDKKGLAYTTVTLGQVYLKMNNRAEAKKFALKGLEISARGGFPHNIRDAARLLSTIYKQEEDWEKALEMHELFVRMKDSVSGIEEKNTLTRKRMQYEYDKETSRIQAEQDKKDLLSEEERKKQTVIIVAVSISLMLTLMVVFIVYRNLRVNKKKNRIISLQKELVEKKNKEILASIEYAKRIQTSLLPTGKYIESNLNRLSSKN